MCDGTRGMYIVDRKEKPRSYNILFEFAGDKYFISIENRGNLWKSMVDHDLENHDRLCEIISYDNIISMNDEDWHPSEYIRGWNDILDKNEACWKYKDCVVEYKERNGLTWLEAHPTVNGVERCQMVYLDWSNCEDLLSTLKECESPIGIIEDTYGLPLGSEDAIPCSDDHKPMGFIRATCIGGNIIDKCFWPTEEEAIADAALCWKAIGAEDREHTRIYAGIIDEDFPVSEDIPIIVASFPDDF